MKKMQQVMIFVDVHIQFTPKLRFEFFYQCLNQPLSTCKKPLDAELLCLLIFSELFKGSNI